MASFDHSTPDFPRCASVATPSPERSEAADRRDLGAIRRARPTPATCHPDRPAWPCSEALLCHACYDLEFRASAFLIGARAAGFPVTETTARNMVVTLNSLALALHAPAEEQAAA